MIAAHFRAGYPAIAIETVEERRCTAAILDELPDNVGVLTVDATGNVGDVSSALASIKQNVPFQRAFEDLAAQDDQVLVVYDWQHLAQNAGQYRALKNAMPELKARGSMIVLVAPAWNLPAELRHDVPVLRMPLPSKTQLDGALSIVAESLEDDAKARVAEQRPQLLDAARGLTLEEAESAFALAASRTGVDPRAVTAEKMRLVRAAGHLEISSPADPLMLGGLDELKRYVREQVIPWRGHPRLSVRGVLLVGVPGTGKSLAAKVIASLLRLPLLRLDVGSLMGGIVGESENNMRAALDVADAIAPAVLWLDEIEKGVAGYASSARTDGGTTLRMLGRFLTWMQERTSDVVVVATCNDYSALPAELTRPGRFSERFFVDCPTPEEREQIAMIHVRLCFDVDSGKEWGGLARQIAESTHDWTGAEIEELVVSLARISRREPFGNSDFEEAHGAIRPMKDVRADEIRQLREWGNTNLRRANGDAPTAPSGRKLRGGK